MSSSTLFCEMRMNSRRKSSTRDMTGGGDSEKRSGREPEARCACVGRRQQVRAGARQQQKRTDHTRSLLLVVVVSLPHIESINLSYQPINLISINQPQIPINQSINLINQSINLTYRSTSRIDQSHISINQSLVSINQPHVSINLSYQPINQSHQSINQSHISINQSISPQRCIQHNTRQCVRLQRRRHQQQRRHLTNSLARYRSLCLCQSTCQ